MNIVELKEELKLLKEQLLTKEVAVKKAIFFGRHYAYLHKWPLQFAIWGVLLLGLTLLKFVVPLIPFVAWVIFDIQRMDELVEEANAPTQEKIDRIEEQIAQHRHLKSCLEYTKKFANQIKQSA